MPALENDRQSVTQGEPTINQGSIVFPDGIASIGDALRGQAQLRLISGLGVGEGGMRHSVGWGVYLNGEIQIFTLNVAQLQVGEGDNQVAGPHSTSVALGDMQLRPEEEYLRQQLLGNVRGAGEGGRGVRPMSATITVFDTGQGSQSAAAGLRAVPEQDVTGNPAR